MAKGDINKMNKENNPLISVIMATYHGDDEGELTEAIDSILLQSYSNIELILCVDGEISKHRQHFIDFYISKDSRVKATYLKQNRGPSTARNKGIDSSNGEFIAIMDADDISMPHRFEFELSELNRLGVDVIGSSYLEFSNDLHTTSLHSFPKEHSQIIKCLPYYCPMASPTILGRRECFLNNKYPEDLRVSEDYYLWVSMVKTGVLFANTKEPLIYYRRGKDFSSRRRGIKYVKGDIIAKFSALSLLPFYLRPFIAIFTLITTVIVRLSPPRIFGLLRAVKHQIFK